MLGALKPGKCGLEVVLDQFKVGLEHKILVLGHVESCVHLV